MLSPVCPRKSSPYRQQTGSFLFGENSGPGQNSLSHSLLLFRLLNNHFYQEAVTLVILAQVCSVLLIGCREVIRTVTSVCVRGEIYVMWSGT